MIITDVNIVSIDPKENGVCAEYSVILDDELMIHKLLVINGNQGYFVAFPNLGANQGKGSKKRYADVVHPVTVEFRQYITNTLVAHYKNELSKRNKE